LPGGTSFYGFLADWIHDALADRKSADLDQIVLVRQKEGPGPYADPVRGVRLRERVGGGKAALSNVQRGPKGWVTTRRNGAFPAAGTRFPA
jgi:hypothetical protein